MLFKELVEDNSILLVLDKLLDGVVIKLALIEVSFEFLLEILRILTTEEESHDLFTWLTV